ncbi:MCP four helix bundle domain-containing protein [Solitalea sp. MAHUQ-68]|uniref:MCP four helix bundle domain-containing protein n=1 Tax=Solitalea agri TaxID=2953739 RepID=A0A9X2JDR9_9SPHI|nr:MCP four helix bundle domain-containing protein [Solitalea agri]MCO4293200.1 MCP four helix bundle domain-containing protein [Solitalea agri]
MMKWAFTLQQKIKISALLVLVFVIVLFKNIYDRKNVVALGASFSTVYEDRLLAESYIFHFSESLHQKMNDIQNANLSVSNVKPLKEKLYKANATIDSLFLSYESTRLTVRESTYYNEFKQTVLNLRKLEDQYLNSSFEQGSVPKFITVMDFKLNAALIKLNQLSEIQISEGKALNEQSKKIIARSTLLTQLELGILIFIGLIIQVLIFTSNSIMPKKPTKGHDLN